MVAWANGHCGYSSAGSYVTTTSNIILKIENDSLATSWDSEAVRFKWSSEAAVSVSGHATINRTHLEFIKLGEL